MEECQWVDEHSSFPALWWDSLEAQFLRESPVGQGSRCQSDSTITGFPPFPVSLPSGVFMDRERKEIMVSIVLPICRS